MTSELPGRQNARGSVPAVVRLVGATYLVYTDEIGPAYATTTCPDCAARYVGDALRGLPAPALPYRCKHTPPGMGMSDLGTLLERAQAVRDAEESRAGNGVTRLVIVANDDSETPVIGEVLGWNGEMALVMWPGGCRNWEPMDELAPWSPR